MSSVVLFIGIGCRKSVIGSSDTDMIVWCSVFVIFQQCLLAFFYCRYVMVRTFNQVIMINLPCINSIKRTKTFTCHAEVCVTSENWRDLYFMFSRGSRNSQQLLESRRPERPTEINFLQQHMESADLRKFQKISDVNPFPLMPCAASCGILRESMCSSATVLSANCLELRRND